MTTIYCRIRWDKADMRSGIYKSKVSKRNLYPNIRTSNCLYEMCSLKFYPPSPTPPTQRNKITYFKIVKITIKEKGMLGSTIFQTWFVPYRPPPLSIYYMGYICIACIIFNRCVYGSLSHCNHALWKEGQLKQFPIKGLQELPQNPCTIYSRKIGFCPWGVGWAGFKIRW